MNSTSKYLNIYCHKQPLLGQNFFFLAEQCRFKFYTHKIKLNSQYILNFYMKAKLTSIKKCLKDLKQGKNNLIKLKNTLPKQTYQLFRLCQNNESSEYQNFLEQIVTTIDSQLNLNGPYNRHYILIYEKLFQELSRFKNMPKLNEYIENSLKNVHNLKKQLTQPKFPELKHDNYERILLPDHQNLQQSCLFYEGWKLFHQQSSLFLQTLEQKDLKDKDGLAKTLCAVANNAKGGVLLIGVSKDLQTKGIDFSEEKKEDIKNQIREGINEILPRVDEKQFKIDFVPVFSSFCQYSQEKTLKVPPIGKYIVRIFIRSSRYRQLKVCQNQSGHYHYPINSSTQITPKVSLYRSLHKHFISSQTYKLKNADLSKQYFPRPLDTQPKTIYKHSSILYISSRKNCCHLFRIFQSLEKNQVKFLKQQPFDFFYKNLNQEIWFISHEEPFQKISEIKLREDPRKRVCFFSVQRHLTLNLKKERVESDLVLQELRNLFFKYFQKKFKMQWLIEQKQDEKREFLALLFDSFSESIFAFSFFMSSNVRAFFYKHKKKEKACHVLKEYEWK